LEYCGPEYCGRIGCSEACWFGNLRRRTLADRRLSRLLKGHQGKLWKVVIHRPKWNPRYGELHEINIKSAKSVVARVLDGYHNPKMLAVGTLKVRPFGYNNFGSWKCESNIIVAGEEDPIDLHVRFHPKRALLVHEIVVSGVNR
jgi:hypothetical protein